MTGPTFSHTVFSIFLASGMTFAEFCSSLDYTEHQVAKLMYGSTRPSNQFVETFCAKFKLDRDKMQVIVDELGRTQ